MDAVDIQGRLIRPGARVVIPIQVGERLGIETVKRLDLRGTSPIIRFNGGGWRTPDRVCVLEEPDG